MKENGNPASQKRGLLRRMKAVESFDSMSSIHDSSWSRSPYTSTNSLPSSLDTPTPKPRRKALALLERTSQRPLSPLVNNQHCYTPVLGRLRIQSEIVKTTSLHGSMTPPIVKRSQTFNAGMSESIPNLTTYSMPSPAIRSAISSSTLTMSGYVYSHIVSHSIKCDYQ